MDVPLSTRLRAIDKRARPQMSLPETTFYAFVPVRGRGNYADVIGLYELMKSSNTRVHCAQRTALVAICRALAEDRWPAVLMADTFYECS